MLPQVIYFYLFLKNGFVGLHFSRKYYKSIFNHFDVIGPKAVQFGETTRNNGHYAVQGHSRSPILVPYQSKAHMWLLISNWY